MSAQGGAERMPLGVAVVGAGYWGPNLVRNFAASDDWDVRWVCDLDEARAARIATGVNARTTTDLEVVLADPDVQAIAIATPASTHAPIALRAIETGRHVLVEKPLASTYSAGEAIVTAAEAAGVLVMCDHTFCYTPTVEYLKSIVDDGTLGEVLFFDSVRINLGLVQHDIDVLWDLAPHDLSILDFVLPDGLRPVAVAAHGADPIGSGQDCVAYLTLQLPNDAIAHVHVNWLSPIKVRMTMIGGSRKTALWDDMNPVTRVSVFDRGVDLVPNEQLDLEARTRSKVAYRTGDMHAPALSGREALAAMVAEFACAIREGRAPRTDGRAGLRVLDILEGASQSLAFKGAVVPLRSGRS
jgi:predicted dehydrogenase